MTIAAKFEIEYLQYLDAEGKQVRDDLPAFAQDLNQMVELYKLMLSTRVFDAKSIALQRTGKLGTYASCLGHEAAHVGIGSAMKPEDVYAPSYREYGAQLYRGVQPTAPDAVPSVGAATDSSALPVPSTTPPAPAPPSGPTTVAPATPDTVKPQPGASAVVGASGTAT